MKLLVAKSTTGSTEKPTHSKGFAVDAPGPVQTKMVVGAVNDRYEQEADRMADRAVRRLHTGRVSHLSSNALQTKCTDCEKKEKLQRKAMNGNSASPATISESAPLPSLTSHQASGSTGGTALPGGTRAEMESVFGADFGRVRIHTDPVAVQMNRQLNARAFTHGSNIYFNQGEYQPGSYEGSKLLAHELTHVLQQQNVRNSLIQRKNGR